jgi:DNA-binding NarL/FixJ family response regulator
MVSPNLSILIVESHPLMRAALSAAITAEPDLAVVAETAGGSETRRVALSLHPDLILFALDTGRWNDLPTLSALRADLPGTPIVVLSSELDPHLHQAAIQSGASMLLLKSTPRDELIRALREIFHLKQLSSGIF